MDLLALLGLGFVLGLRHAADPDHVAAVAALTARTRRLGQAAWLGIAWGMGHTLTLFVVGAAIIVFNLTMPPRLGLGLELVVAVVLVVVGLRNLGDARPDARLEASRLPAHRAFGVGLAHGLAGSAAVALLVLATVRDARAACAYLAVFGLGTVAGMVIVTTGFAATLATALTRWPRFQYTARQITGVAAVALGVWLIIHIGFVDGLFRPGAPNFDPH